MGRGAEKQRGVGSKARGGRGEAGGEGGELASVGPTGKVSGRTRARALAGAEQPPFSSHRVHLLHLISPPPALKR